MVNFLISQCTYLRIIIMLLGIEYKLNIMYTAGCRCTRKFYWMYEILSNLLNIHFGGQHIKYVMLYVYKIL